MTKRTEFDTWSAGKSYEHCMGRWSRKIAAEFLDRLAPPAGADWLEVGCGTGALTKTILSSGASRSVLATDRSEAFVDHADRDNQDERARSEVADAMQLPSGDASVDIVTSALVMNFVPDRQKALAEARRVHRSNGRLAFHVWDYPGGGMGFIDAFWKAAAEVDENAVELDESARFPFCTPDGLTGLCSDAGMPGADIAGIEVETTFPDFEAFWQPFTLGAGPAPGYCKSLPEDKRRRLKRRLAATLGTGGPVVLPARAWAVRADKPD